LIKCCRVGFASLIIGRALRNVERSLLMPILKQVIQLNNGLVFFLIKEKKRKRKGRGKVK